MSRFSKYTLGFNKLILSLILIAGVNATVFGTTFVVTKTADTNDGICDADCSLREAISAANIADTNDIINFVAAVFSTPQTITLSGTELINGNVLISSGNLTINGRGPNLLTISGNNASRVFYNRNSTLTLNQMTITGGNGVSSLNSGLGGAVYTSGGFYCSGCVVTSNMAIMGGGIYISNTAGPVSVFGTVSENRAVNGGGIYFTGGSADIKFIDITRNTATGAGGGIYINDGNTQIVGANVANNTATGAGGGIYNGGSGRLYSANSPITGNQTSATGGGIYNVATADLQYAVVSGNRANPSSGIEGGGGIDNRGTLTMTGVALNYNAARNSSVGGGLLNKGTASATISTIGGNTAEGGGAGLINYGTGTLDLVGVTVAKNVSSGGDGGGVFNLSNGTVRALNTIVANNAANTGADFSGAFVSQGFNLIQNIGGLTGTLMTTDITGQDPQFLPPNYGSTNEYYALSAASPAVDKGFHMLGMGLDIDQRGLLRPYDNPLIANASGGDGSDIGAFERQAQDASNRTAFDFDGDGDAEVSLFRPSNQTWYVNFPFPFQSVFIYQFGTSSDVIVPADYDGDGKTDIAVYRNGTWYLQRSTSGFAVIQFGLTADIPAPADFDGDGKADLAVYRPVNGTWYVLNLANNAFNTVQFGVSTDKPVAADYDGDGKADYAVYRPDSGTWYLLQSTAGFAVVQFGISTDKPVIGDYDGDLKADIAVYRPATGVWYLRQSTRGFAATQFGVVTDLPAAADYDGDGSTDLGVFRPETGVWYELKSAQGFGTVQFGLNGDKPLANAFVR